jgi:sterol desaturase/sphingolipid hydroxylase (fatty acid hydroxylase superfamily)
MTSVSVENLEIHRKERSYFSFETLLIWIHFLFITYISHSSLIEIHKYFYYEGMTMTESLFKVKTPVLILLLLIINAFYYCLYRYKLPSFEKLKITNLPFPWEENPEKFKKDFPSILKIYLFNLVILTSVLHLIFGRFYKMRNDESYPTFLETLLAILVYVFYEDFCFHWSHRFLHLPFIYPKIHKVHHKIFNVFHLSCVHTHYIEYIIGNYFPSAIGMLVFGPCFHFISFTTFVILRLLETHEAHGGYEFQYSIFKINPWGIESNYHNFHHLKNIGNYSTFFFLWDSIFQTNKYYFKVKSS